MDIDKHDAEQRIATLENEKMIARYDRQMSLIAQERAEAGAREDARKGIVSQGEDISLYFGDSTALGKATIKIGWICLLMFFIGMKFPAVYWVMTQDHWLMVGIVCLVLGYLSQFLILLGFMVAIGNLLMHPFSWGELLFSIGIVLLSGVCANLFRRVNYE